MKLVLKAEETFFNSDLPFDIQSISSSGLVVLCSNDATGTLSPQPDMGQPEEGTPLSFTAEIGGRTLPLRGRLVWLETSGSDSEPSLADDAPRIELIVDTAEEPGWQELSDLFAEGSGN